MFKRRRQPPPGSGLHQCPVCHHDYVVPVGAAPFDPGAWGLRLRCGQCEIFRDVVVGDDVAKQYDLDLSRGRAEIAAALAHADHERMTAEAQHFIAALKRDLIDAGDFSPG